MCDKNLQVFLYGGESLINISYYETIHLNRLLGAMENTLIKIHG